MTSHSVLLARLERFQFVIGLILLVTAGFVFLWHGPMPLESVVLRFAQIDEMRRFATDPSTLRKYYALSTAVVLGLLGTITLIAAAWRRFGEEQQAIAWRLATTLACSCSLILYTLRMQYEGDWLPISRMITNPESLPVFGHRLLFVWIARGFHAVIPGLSYMRSYHLSQIVAAVLAVYALGRWSSLFAGEALSWVGQVCGVVLLSTCLNYYNFYDIGIVLFTTLGLISIYRRKYIWLVPIVAAGTLNHEGILLLIAVAAFVAYEGKHSEPLKVWLLPIGAALLVHILIRLALAKSMPMRAVDWRVWSNMIKPFLLSREFMQSGLALIGWYGLGLAGLRYCDGRLMKMTVLFPLLAGVTFLFGQFVEGRQFDAFIPVLIAILLSATVRKFEIEREQIRQLELLNPSS